MNSSRPDVVFDCNIFLQGIARANGPAARALRLVEENRITLHISRPILREVRRTLAYPEIRQLNRQVTDDAINAFLSHLLFRSSFQRQVPHVFDYPRDRKDEAYIDLAASIQADYLVTRDKDLLSLATDHSIEAKQFRQQFRLIRLVNPVDFLSLLNVQHP